MLTGLDFSISYPVQCTWVAVAFFPVTLIIMARLTPLVGRNALQFLLSFVVTTTFWLLTLFFLIQKSQTIDLESFLTSFFLYSGLLLVYLEIWGLLSRGYTLGLLLTFYKSRTALSAKEAAASYRGGEGLDWLIKHRFSGLISAKMIKVQDDKVILTARGTVIAYLYKLAILFFGLRYSG